MGWGAPTKSTIIHGNYAWAQPKPLHGADMGPWAAGSEGRTSEASEDGALEARGGRPRQRVRGDSDSIS